MHMRRLLIAGLLSVLSASAVDQAMLDLLLPGTQFVFGVRVRNLIRSPLAEKFAGDMRLARVEFGEMVKSSGFDPLDSLDEVLIVSTAQGKNAPTLVIGRGRFAGAMSLPGATAYHGVPVYSGKGKA